MPSTSTCDARRPQYDMQFLLTALSLSALWLSLWGITTLASKTLLAIYGLTYLFGCWKTRRAMLFVSPALYLPYVWLITDWPWDAYRRQWIAMGWQLPGLLAEAPWHPLPEVPFAIVTSLVTLGCFFTAIFAARPSLKAAWITSLVVLLLSIGNSFVCYSLFRA